MNDEYTIWCEDVSNGVRSKVQGAEGEGEDSAVRRWLSRVDRIRRRILMLDHGGMTVLVSRNGGDPVKYEITARVEVKYRMVVEVGSWVDGGGLMEDEDGCA